jgi:HSP20 family molecular chaperone IbpA
MVRRFHRSIYDELDELRASMDYLYQLALAPDDYPLLPEGDSPDIICQSVHTLNVEISAHGEEVTVTLDTIPGDGTAKMSMALFNEKTLSLTWTLEKEIACSSPGNRLCGKQSFSLHRVIPLPVPVVPGGARISLKNGVLDLQLKKAQLDPSDSHT